MELRENRLLIALASAAFLQFATCAAQTGR
jgi:hypothetical protein